MLLPIDLMYLSMLSLLPPLVLGVIFFKKQGITIKILSVFLCIYAVLEIVAHAYFLNKMNNMRFLHYFTILEFIAVMLIYFSLIKTKIYRMIILILTFLVSIFLAYPLFDANAINELNSLQRVIEAITLLFLLVFYFIYLSKKSKIRHLEDSPIFLLSSGLFIYFSGTLLLFHFSKGLVGQGLFVIWSIHSFLNVFLNIIYAIVIWKGSRTSKLL